MSTPLKNYLEAYNLTAAAILAGELPADEAKQALSMVAVAGTERLISVNASLAHARRLCELTEAEKAASVEGCTIRLRPENRAKPRRRPRVRFVFR